MSYSSDLSGFAPEYIQLLESLTNPDSSQSYSAWNDDDDDDEEFRLSDQESSEDDDLFIDAMLSPRAYSSLSPSRGDPSSSPSPVSSPAASPSPLSSPHSPISPSSPLTSQSRPSSPPPLPDSVISTRAPRRSTRSRAAATTDSHPSSSSTSSSTSSSSSSSSSSTSAATTTALTCLTGTTPSQSLANSAALSSRPLAVLPACSSALHAPLKYTTRPLCSLSRGELPLPVVTTLRCAPVENSSSSSPPRKVPRLVSWETGADVLTSLQNPLQHPLPQQNTFQHPFQISHHHHHHHHQSQQHLLVQYQSHQSQNSFSNSFPNPPSSSSLLSSSLLSSSLLSSLLSSSSSLIPPLISPLMLPDILPPAEFFAPTAFFVPVARLLPSPMLAPLQYRQLLTGERPTDEPRRLLQPPVPPTMTVGQRAAIKDQLRVHVQLLVQTVIYSLSASRYRSDELARVLATKAHLLLNDVATRFLLFQELVLHQHHRLVDSLAAIVCGTIPMPTTRCYAISSPVSPAGVWAVSDALQNAYVPLQQAMSLPLPLPLVSLPEWGAGDLHLPLRGSVFDLPMLPACLSISSSLCSAPQVKRLSGEEAETIVRKLGDVLLPQFVAAPIKLVQPQSSADWSSCESKYLIELAKHFACDFDLIAPFFPTRTRRQIHDFFINRCRSTTPHPILSYRHEVEAIPLTPEELQRFWLWYNRPKPSWRKLFRIFAPRQRANLDHIAASIKAGRLTVVLDQPLPPLPKPPPLQVSYAVSPVLHLPPLPPLCDRLMDLPNIDLATISSPSTAATTLDSSPSSSPSALSPLSLSTFSSPSSSASPLTTPSMFSSALSSSSSSNSHSHSHWSPDPRLANLSHFAKPAAVPAPPISSTARLFSQTPEQQPLAPQHGFQMTQQPVVGEEEAFETELIDSSCSEEELFSDYEKEELD